MQNSRPELLAPVGSWEALIAAVENGADAVYLGGKAFSARAYASNFDEEEMIKAFKYAHLRGVRVFVTVNTILGDHELEEAAKYLKFLYEEGVDAIIAQDLGVARLARELLPNLELHASTQMTIHNSNGVRLLQEMGFKRIVLAREVSLANIKQIKAETGAELETFVHGALCICYSGQCLMSSLIGGRSGNRGRCAQPCRLNYSLVDDKRRDLIDIEKFGKHLLSPKDLKTIEHLPDLIDAGIDSLKIEGRMKRPEYVATVVKTYRQALDRALAEKNYKVETDEEKKLRQIFNRDFSSGYFYGNLGSSLMSYKRPNNRGLRLGRINKVDFKTKKVEIALEEWLRLGDGIEVWVTQGGRQGIIVHQIYLDGKLVEEAPPGSKVSIEIPGKIRVGDRVFKTHDEHLVKEAKITYAEGKGTRKIPIQCSVYAKVGEPMKITVESSEGLIGYGETEFIGQIAQKRPLTEESIYKQLERIGNTAFVLEKVNYQIDDNVMVPISEINEARRKAIANLEEAILHQYKNSVSIDKRYFAKLENITKLASTPPMSSKYSDSKKPRLSVAVGDIYSVEEAVKSGADIIYFGGESYRSKDKVTKEAIEKAAKLCSEKGASFYLSTPRILQENEYQRYIDKIHNLDFQDIDGVLIGQIGLIKHFQALTDKPLVGDFGLNIFNHQSLLKLKDWGMTGATLSPELTMEQIRKIGGNVNIQKEAIVHGALPLMISEYCAVGCTIGDKNSDKTCSTMPCLKGKYGLKDRMNYVFGIETDEHCRMHLFNPKELALVEDIQLLADNGIDIVRIEARKETKEYVRKVTKIYAERIKNINRSNTLELEEMKKRLEELSKEGLTKGHYYRGVL